LGGGEQIAKEVLPKGWVSGCQVLDGWSELRLLRDFGQFIKNGQGLVEARVHNDAYQAVHKSYPQPWRSVEMREINQRPRACDRRPEFDQGDGGVVVFVMHGEPCDNFQSPAAAAEDVGFRRGGEVLAKYPGPVMTGPSFPRRPWSWA
jgi:hypothetical protein